ncbi:hypothetical protein, partial [Nostoc foliaceum]
SASPIPGKNTSASPIPGKNTSASPIPGKNTSASPIPGKNTSGNKALDKTKFSIWEQVGLPFMRLFIGTAVVPLISLPIFSNLVVNQKEKVVDNFLEKIHDDLKIFEQKLRAIAVKADNMS